MNGTTFLIFKEMPINHDVFLDWCSRLYQIGFNFHLAMKRRSFLSSTGALFYLPGLWLASASDPKEEKKLHFWGLR